jgi:hypothetical protein
VRLEIAREREGDGRCRNSPQTERRRLALAPTRGRAARFCYVDSTRCDIRRRIARWIRGQNPQQ